MILFYLFPPLQFFDFHTTELLHTMTLPSSISSLVLHRPSSLLCLISTDLTLRLIDITSRKLVRHFKTFRGKILSVTFSPDGRWLLASSLDSLIRTFDIPSSRLINAFKTNSIAVSITFSPTSDFLATCHLDEKGIFLWSNQTLFKDVALRGWTETDLDRILNDDQSGVLPITGGNSEDQEQESDDEDDVPELFSSPYTTPDQLSSSTKGSLITLTSLPKSRWTTLLNLDVIKFRNKPKEKPKVPEKAPFFLPQVEGVSGDFDVSKRIPLGMEDVEMGSNGGGDSRRLVNESHKFLDVETDFTRRLREAHEKDECELPKTIASSSFARTSTLKMKNLRLILPSSPLHSCLSALVSSDNSFFLYLHSLPVPTLDSELRSLTSFQHLSFFLKALSSRMKERKDFEGVQVLLSVFLKLHGDVLVENGKKPKSLKELVEQKTKALNESNGMGMEIDEESEDEEEGEVGDREGRLLAESLREVIVEQHHQSERLIEMLDYCLGTLAFTRNLPLT